MVDDRTPANTQLPLIPDDDDDGRAALEAMVEPRGPGRPPGSPNKRTEATVQYLLSRYRSPLEALAAVYAKPLPELVAEITAIWRQSGDDRAQLSFSQILQVLQMQVNAAKELAPYLHQKQPQAVEVDHSGAIPLAIYVDPGLAHGLEHALADGQITIDAELADNEENQGVSDGDKGQSDGAELDE